MSIIVDVPLPRRGLSPNRIRSQHWRKSHAAKVEYWKELNNVIQLQEIKSLPVPAVIDYTFYTARLRMSVDGKRRIIPDARYRPKDDDNAKGSMKAFQDYLVEELKVLPDDKASTVRIGKVKLWGDKQSENRCFVRVTIREDRRGRL